ncbi:GNAT family N-acetyltransferase [Lewinella sp. LCG006]|uniref:GNAT family N-acetyltransferase n=1 Tax=Lewinella sp. LCG006 TaxID=3231911 RepID=UPI003460C21A
MNKYNSQVYHLIEQPTFTPLHLSNDQRSTINHPITTPRLQLRALSMTDAPAIFRLHTDVDVQRYLSRERMGSPLESREFIMKITEGVEQGRWLYWGIVLQTAPEVLIGTVCLWQFTEHGQRAELGYDLLPSYQQQGIMTEAVRGVLALAQAHPRLAEIHAMVRSENLASVNLLKKLNFSYLRNLQEEEKFTKEQGMEIRIYCKTL